DDEVVALKDRLERGDEAPPIGEPDLPEVPAAPAAAMRAEAEDAEAAEIFNLDEEPDAAAPVAVTVEEEEPEAIVLDEPPAGGADEDYGPKSRIQEIQAADAAGQPIDEEFISEHLTEAEVFVKYGLFDKAREQLKQVLQRYPQHDVAHLRMKEIAVGEGNKDA